MLCFLAVGPALLHPTRLEAGCSQGCSPRAQAGPSKPSAALMGTSVLPAKGLLNVHRLGEAEDTF